MESYIDLVNPRLKERIAELEKENELLQSAVLSLRARMFTQYQMDKCVDISRRALHPDTASPGDRSIADAIREAREADAKMILTHWKHEPIAKLIAAAILEDSQ